jgi:predicted dehydrogenase
MPFNENRFHYNWHWHWNFGTGDMGNDGAHQIDQARWALGVDLPTEVSGMGRKISFDDDQQTPDTMVITFNYPKKVLMFEMRLWTPYKLEGVDNGIAIYGTDGMVHIGRWTGEGSGFKVFDKAGKMVSFEKETGGDGHAKNFIECVRSRQAPNAEIEIGYISSVHCHLGNIVARTGRTLRLNGNPAAIPNDSEATRLARRDYRKHWATPKGV